VKWHDVFRREELDMVRQKLLFAAVAILLTGVAASAQDACPCVPLGYVWISTPCETWNCAQAAMILANGDAHVMSVPTRSAKYKWVVLRRIVSGSAVVSPDNPFELDSYESPADAARSYASFAADRMPLMLTTTDGKTLVVRLRQAEIPPDGQYVTSGSR
jgi:hypothetical protein